VLTTHTDLPVVTQTSVQANLLHALNVLTKGLVHQVGNKLLELSVLVVLLSVKEPLGDLELEGVLDDSKDALLFVLGELTSSLLAIDIGHLAHNKGESSSHTLD